VDRKGQGNARRIQVEQIDRGWPWNFFDGADSGDHLLYGEGGCLHLSEHHFFFLRVGLGADTNNFSEILALKLLLLFVVEKGCKTLQVFGDSLLIINWVNRKQNCHIARLLPILEEVMRIISTFDIITFSHIYREQNKMADRLSKEASQLEYGRWHIMKHTTEGSFDYHKPFQDGQL
jgi:ribonuclease HI